MPICKNCNEKFPNRITVSGKERNLCKRKYCLKCSPFGLHNTRDLNAEIHEGSLKTCSICGKQYIYRRGTGFTIQLCSSCKVSERRRSIKKLLVDYKGGKCSGCKYKKFLGALQFHHTNPEEKDFQISGNHCRSIEKLKKEVDKCVLLCGNCHSEVHAGIRVITR
jgi:hypothetical protein